MALRFQPSEEYRKLRDEVDQVVMEVIDAWDPKALVYVGGTGMGLIHVIVVSDKLASLWDDDRDDRLWDELEPRLSDDAFSQISVLQVLDTNEALKLHGPLDVERLLRVASEQIQPAWERLKPELGGGSIHLEGRQTWHQDLHDLIQLTQYWGHTCERILRTPSLRSLLALTLPVLRALRHHLTGGTVVGPIAHLDEIPEFVSKVIQELGAMQAVPVAA